MFERFSDRARKVMALANQEAVRFKVPTIAPEHVLLGITYEGTGVAANALKNLDVDLRKLNFELVKLLTSPTTDKPASQTTSGQTKAIIELAIAESRQLGHNYVGTEHLLLGLLRAPSADMAPLLTRLGLRIEDVRAEIINLLGVGESSPNQPCDPSSMSMATSPPTTDALDFAVRQLIETADPIAHAQLTRMQTAMRHANYDRTADAKAALEKHIADKAPAIRALLLKDAALSRLVARAADSLNPDTPITAANLLLAFIRAHPNLQARLTPLMTELERVLHDRPPSESQ